MPLIKELYTSLFVDDLMVISANSTPCDKGALKKRLMCDLARVTLFSYILLVFNPVMPIVADKMAHTFWEKYHLLTVHEANGKFHVHMELTKAGHSEKHKSGSLKSDADEFVHVITKVGFDFSNRYFIRIPYSSYSISCLVSYPDNDLRPPKA